MSTESARAGFAVSLGVDSMLDSALEPSVRVLGLRMDGPELVIIVERGGEVDQIPLREAVRRQRSSLPDSMRPVPFGLRHDVLTWVSPAKREKALELQGHLDDVLHGRSSAPGRPAGPYDAITTTRSERRRAKTRELRVSEPTMSRRLQAYRDFGLLGLVPHASRALDASGALDVAPEILAIAADFVVGRRLDSRKALDSDYALLVDELRQRGLVTLCEDDEAGGDGRVPRAEEALPYSKFKKMVRHLDRGRAPRSAKVRQQQDNRPHVDGYRFRAHNFGDRIEMDSTPIDVFVRGVNGPVKAHAVFAICTSTRYLWVRVVAGSPRGRDLALLLWDMAGGESSIVPDSAIGARVVPAIPRQLAPDAWRSASPPPASLPGCVVLDHGAEEENGRLTRYCAQLAVSIDWARTQTPTDKAYVESVISQFARMCHLLPGHKGNTVENRPKNDPAHLPTIEMLQAAVEVWQQFHVTTEHTGLPHPHTPGHFLSPLQAVQSSIMRGVPLPALTDPTLTLGLLEHTSQTPQDDGITFRRRRYTCPGYEDIVTASLGPDGRRRKLTFYFDPNRPGRLYWPIPNNTGADVRVLMCPEEAGEAVRPFADVQDAWLQGVDGRKYSTPSHVALGKAELARAMREAMTSVETPTADNVIPIRAARARDMATSHRQAKAIGGWDFTDVMNLLDADPDTEKDTQADAASVAETEEES